jgi:phospholipase/lecithinase/hemolysin
MDRRQGCMRLRGGVLAALLYGVAAGTQAGDQSYSNLYFFGDSITDSGTFRPLVGPNARFTTKPGTVWAENLGANYGKSVTPAYAVYPATPPGFAPQRQWQQPGCRRRARQCATTEQSAGGEPAVGNHAGRRLPRTRASR